MEPSTASRTALIASLMRAFHTRADPHTIFADPWGDHLVSEVDVRRICELVRSVRPSVAGACTEPNQVVDRWFRATMVYTTIVARSRYAEDALHVAVKRGVRQYVLIGAGLDSYALRMPPDGQGIEIFEVDHPATQALKKERMSECGFVLPANVHFLAADLVNEGLAEVLGRSRYDPARTSFFSCLGVAPYLTRDANLALWRAIAQVSQSGSELVFNYNEPAMLRDEPNEATSAWSDVRRLNASIGEPMLSVFEPGAIARDLRDAGLELVEDLDVAQALARYDPLGLNGMRPLKFSHFARAVVMNAGQQSDR